MSYALAPIGAGRFHISQKKIIAIAKMVKGAHFDARKVGIFTPSNCWSVELARVVKKKDRNDPRIFYIY